MAKSRSRRTLGAKGWTPYEYQVDTDDSPLAIMARDTERRQMANDLAHMQFQQRQREARAREATAAKARGTVDTSYHPGDTASSRAERISREAHHINTPQAHSAAAHAHIEAHAAVRDPRSKEHHDRRRHEHVEAAFPQLREGPHRAAAPTGQRAVHVAQHGTAGRGTPHDQAMAQATQTGAKGGKFVISKSGKKRYVKK